MEKNMKTLLSTYYGDGNGRAARLYAVRQMNETFEVEFMENDKIVSSVPIPYSERFAEDACENWVEGIIK